VNPPREDVARRRCGSPARSTLPVGDLAQSARRPALRLKIWRRSGSSARPPPQIDNLVPAFGGSEISQAGTDGGGTERVLCTWEMEPARMDSAFSIDAVTTYASEVPHLCCNRWAGHVGLCSSPPHLGSPFIHFTIVHAACGPIPNEVKINPCLQLQLASHPTWH
jgi:hypothetical protein